MQHIGRPPPLSIEIGAPRYDKRALSAILDEDAKSFLGNRRLTKHFLADAATRPRMTPAELKRYFYIYQNRLRAHIDRVETTIEKHEANRKIGLNGLALDTSLLDIRTEKGQTLLNLAILSDKYECMKALLDGGANPFVENTERLNAIDCGLVSKIQSGHATGDYKPIVVALLKDKDISRLLFDRGLNFLKSDHKGQNILTLCVERGDADALKMLLFHSSHSLKKIIRNHLDERDERGDTPLTLACTLNRIDCVDLLLEAGVDVTLPNSLNFSPLSLAARHSSPQVSDRILNQSSENILLATSGASPLLRLAFRADLNDIKTIKSFYERVNPGYTTRLDFHLGEKELIDLFAYGSQTADPNICGALEGLFNRTSICESLALAIKRDDAETTKSILQTKEIRKSVAEALNNHDRLGDTPLTIACKKGEVILVQALLKAGAKPNFLDAHGVSPSRVAADSASPKIQAALIAALQPSNQKARKRTKKRL